MQRKNFVLLLIGVLMLFCLSMLTDNFGFSGMQAWNMMIFSSFGLIGMLIWIFAAILWIWALLDCLKNPALKNGVDRLVWIIVIVFLHVLGALIYYLVMKNQPKKKTVVMVRKRSVKKKPKKRKK